MSDHEGLLLLDKPVGPTSHDVVQIVRRAFGVRRVGHAGTLDPPASGLLPILLGRATRLARFLPDDPKCYVGAFRLGLTSLTDDASSPTHRGGEERLPPPSAVTEAAADLEGPQMQVPPAISARRVDGQRLYRINRSAARVAGPAKAVVVRRFRVHGSLLPDLYTLDASVSPGTYIRALVRDLGARLGCGAVLVELRRISIGPFLVEHAIPPPVGGPCLPAGIPRCSFFPLDHIPLSPPDCRLDGPERAERFVRGLPIEAPDDGCRTGSRVVTTTDGRRLGIGILEGDRLHPCVVLRSPAELGRPLP